MGATALLLGLSGAYPVLAVAGTGYVAGTETRYVSSQFPISGAAPVQQQMAATRAVDPAAAASAVLAPVGQPANTWATVATLTGAVVHDVVFPTAFVGYAAAELGQVWKTTDGGTTWIKILDRGFPYYFYGIDALSADRIVVSGFNDMNFHAIGAETDDGGKTWSPDQTFSSAGWADRIRFVGAAHGLALSLISLHGPNAAWRSTSSHTWEENILDPNGGWFGDQFTLLTNLHAYASGITFCASATAGASWACRPSIDEVFDGPTEFVNDTDGWVGGGEILPNVAGWLHRTTDGGQTWSDRVLNTPWPIRQIHFLTPKVGWATGGNVFSHVGGIYFTNDGGQTWVQDLDTGTEVGSCADHPSGAGQTTVWCIGFSVGATGFSSSVYRTTVVNP
ncbi:MAG TPA: hypothetical protein VE441_01585 [Mycobacterium sp.]|nr:hypothetical protein [Mycobacterium sp.]